MPEFTLSGIAQHVGKELGVSSWVTVDQSRINQFADCSGDRQWIHVDVARAKRESPYRAPIAHGYLTLALCARHIDVDPLTIAAAFGELVDPRLIHRNPARHAQFLPNVLGDSGKSEFRHCESSSSAFARCRLSHSAKNFSMIAADSTGRVTRNK